MNREELIVTMQGNDMDTQCMLLDGFIKDKIKNVSKNAIDKFISLKKTIKEGEVRRYIVERRELFGDLLIMSDDRRQYLEKQKYRK